MNDTHPRPPLTRGLLSDSEAGGENCKAFFSPSVKTSFCHLPLHKGGLFVWGGGTSSAREALEPPTRQRSGTLEGGIHASLHRKGGSRLSPTGGHKPPKGQVSQSRQDRKIAAAEQFFHPEKVCKICDLGACDSDA